LPRLVAPNVVVPAFASGLSSSPVPASATSTAFTTVSSYRTRHSIAAGCSGWSVTHTATVKFGAVAFGIVRLASTGLHGAVPFVTSMSINTSGVASALAVK